jgi:hypothetical protein
MITTKVRQLTAMNVRALRSVETIYITEGKTYVIFDGTPSQALTAVEQTMAAQPGRTTTYRSLEAVRRKLRPAAPYRIDPDAVKGVTKLTDYVQIAR